MESFFLEDTVAAELLPWREGGWVRLYPYFGGSILLCHGDPDGGVSVPDDEVRENDLVICCFPKQVLGEHPGWAVLFPEWDDELWFKSLPCGNPEHMEIHIWKEDAPVQAQP